MDYLDSFNNLDVQSIERNISFSSQPHQRAHRYLGGDLNEFISVALISTLSSIFSVISIYLISQKKRLRPVDLLVGNLSFSTFFMCISLVALHSFTQLSNFPSFFQSTLFCGFINFSKYFPGVVATLSSFSISLERITSLKAGPDGRCQYLTTATILKFIILIWIIAFGITFPQFLRSVSSEMPTSVAFKSCKRVPLFNSKFAEVLYELFKFFFLHVIFSCYLIYELYLIRSKIKYLWASSVPGRLQNKICRVRFAFIYSIILIFMWTSSGVVHLMYKLPIWFQNTSSQSQESSSSRNLTFLRITMLLYLLMNLLSVFLCSQEFEIFRPLMCCGVEQKSQNNSNNKKEEGLAALTKKMEDRDEDFSRFETQATTTFSQSIKVSDDEDVLISEESQPQENQVHQGSAIVIIHNNTSAIDMEE